MEKILSFVMLFALSVSVEAQSPLITEANVYLEGDITPIAWCSNDTEPGESGEDVTWDFSGLVEVEEQVFTYVNPQETPLGYEFPDATLCGLGDDGYHSYYSLANGFLNVEGYGGVNPENQFDTLKVLYSDKEELIPIPFEFGDAHSDIFSGINEALGFVVPFTGEIDFEVDGYGTLILPNGTFENVVRYHFTRSQTNTVLGQATTTTKEQWGWMSSDYRFWLCLMETNDNGFSEEDIVWYAKSPLVLSTNELKVKPIKVYPNPVSSGGAIRFHSDSDKLAIIEVFGLDGRRLESKTQRLNRGENLVNFESILTTGIYVLSIQYEEMRMTSKLMIE